MRMFYKSTCEEWLNGLPIGNGRLAAMICNGEKADMFHMNHEWLWRGTPEGRDRHADKVADRLPEIRKLLAEGDSREAIIRANNFFGGGGGQAGKFYPEDYEGRTPHLARLDNYQPAGTLVATFDLPQTLKERALDLQNGLASVIRTVEGGEIKGEHHANCVCNLLSYHWTSEQPFGMTFTYTREEDPNSDFTFTFEGNVMYYRCAFHQGQQFIVKMVIDTDGELCPNGEAMQVKNAKNIRVITDIGVLETGLEEELARQ
ncbi:MAG: glycoside hydrolase N-terminal domain-containing protein, partial [Clostridia bacterium]|nr:glycoside hydrolase N-terminal domain-containing protein [Clostridia bacterium]